MLVALTPFLVGVLCVLIGISNCKGNISSLHSYHHSRVLEEDRIPFGKKVGLGTILCGVGVMLYSIFLAISIHFDLSFLVWIGTAFLAVFFVIGMGISFAAMIRYNKGIF